MLADIVSKNGNLLLNVPMRGDGTIDADELKFLDDMAAWMAVNSEAIYGTRPWLIFGEGPNQAAGGQFNEGKQRAYTARDVRFTTKGGRLYAILLGWPEGGAATIRSLAKLPGVEGEVTGVRLLGHPGRLKWAHDETGLTVALPDAPPCEHAYVLRITGKRLDGFRPELVADEPAAPVAPDAEGNLTLDTASAELHGSEIRFETRAGRENVGFWNRAEDWVSWSIRLPASATFEVQVECATGAGESSFVAAIGGQELIGQAPSTGDWDRYATVSLGTVALPGGEHPVSVKPRAAQSWRPINLRAVRLARVE
jgi:alpha-L-fucosidase